MAGLGAILADFHIELESATGEVPAIRTSFEIADVTLPTTVTLVIDGAGGVRYHTREAEPEETSASLPVATIIVRLRAGNAHEVVGEMVPALSWDDDERP